MSMAEVFDLIKTEVEAERSLIAYRWPDGPGCPKTGCGSQDIRECKGYARANELPINFVCRACDRRFTVRTGYFLSESPISFRTWFWALYLVLTATERDPITQASVVRLLGVSEACAPSVIERIRKHIRDPVSWTGAPITMPINQQEKHRGRHMLPAPTTPTNQAIRSRTPNERAIFYHTWN